MSGARPELRVSLLGQGFMGKAHSNAFAQVGRFFDIPFRLRLRVLCGRDRVALEHSAQAWGWEQVATDWREVVERPDIDLVDIALPNHLHAEAAIAAARAGKIVLCEKPLANSVDEAEAMVQAARAVSTMVWFNYRRVPAVRYARQLIEEDRIGRVFHYRGSYQQQWGTDTNRAMTWKMDPVQAGHGVVGDLLSHAIDLALYLNGPVERITALTKTFMPGRAVEDAVASLATFQNGSMGMLEATRFGVGSRNGNRFEIQGQNGMLQFDLEDLNRLQFFDARDPGHNGMMFDGFFKLPLPLCKPSCCLGILSLFHRHSEPLSSLILSLKNGPRRAHSAEKSKIGQNKTSRCPSEQVSHYAADCAAG